MTLPISKHQLSQTVGTLQLYQEESFTTPCQEMAIMLPPYRPEGRFFNWICGTWVQTLGASPIHRLPKDKKLSAIA